VWVGFLKSSNSSDPSCEVEHVDAAAYFAYEGPFDVLVDGVEEGKEGGDVIGMDGRHGVVSLAEPKEDDANRGEGWWDVRRVVDEAVSGKGVCLEFCHQGIGDRGALNNFGQL
jgi:hypothetical protein